MMKKDGQKKRIFINRTVLTAVLVGVLLLGSVCVICTYSAKKEVTTVMEETLEFMRLQCLRYDNLSASLETRDAIQLLDKTKELGRCLAGQEAEEDFLTEYASAQRISGIILMSDKGEVTADISMDDADELNWQEILQDENVTNVIDYPKKTYVSHVLMKDGTDYDYAAIANADGDGLIFCYVRQVSYATDENQINIGNMLDGYRLEMDGLLLITDGETILSSNDSDLTGMPVSESSLLADNREDIPSDTTGRIRADDTVYIAQSGMCRTYYLYAFFPARSVYQNRIVMMAYVLAFYVFCLLILSMLRQRGRRFPDESRVQS
jgi:hypothetical protein